nr:hypothetical protein [uncultured Sulfurimonas sp.]
MNLEELEKKLCELISLSLSDKSSFEQISFPIPEEAVKRAWKYSFIDIRGYQCIVRSNEIRHIYKEHAEEVWHICKIVYLLEKFATVTRTTIPDNITRKPITSLVFTKKTKNNQIRIVKTNISRNKILRLKTLFEVV